LTRTDKVAHGLFSNGSDNAELKNEKGAIPQCFEESPHVLGIIQN